MSGFEQTPQIEVFAKDKCVGKLIFTSPHECNFEYDEVWMEIGYPISPHLPFTSKAEPKSVISFIRNLFPEGSAFDMLLESENVSGKNLYAILKAIGRDTVGMLTFSCTPAKSTAELRRITNTEIIQRLNKNSSMVIWDGKFRLSVAGVQNKLNVFIDDDDDLFLADGNYSSTHILKFSSNDFNNIVINELFCMRLAAKIGIDAAQVNIRHINNHSILVVKRFDRNIRPDYIEKRHIIDGCQALDLPPEYKYERLFGDNRDVAHIRDGVSIKKLFEFTENCTVPALAKQRLLDWILFNLIIGNSDSHGKNISFHTGRGGYSVAPFYDLVSVIFEAKNKSEINTSLAMAIGDNFDINNITAYDLLSMAEECDIKFNLLKRRLQIMITSCKKTISELDFSQDTLTYKQTEVIVSLGKLVNQRCDLLKNQLDMFNKVISGCFSA